MSAPDETADLHVVIGLTRIFCNTCEEELEPERDGRDALGHMRYRAKCWRCHVTVAIPVMVARVLVIDRTPP
jgi:hypothetical protein